MARALKSAERKIRDDGNVTGGNVKLFDLAKQELDDRIGAAQRAGKNNEARRLLSIKSELVGEMDEQVPVYAQARSVFGGHASALDALDEGRSFLRRDPEEISKALSAMNPGERQMFMVGAIRQMRDRMVDRSDGADVYKRFVLE